MGGGGGPLASDPLAVDGGLVRRARDGEFDAWRALVERLERPVWEAAAGASSDAGIREDACLATWLRLVEQLDTFDAAGQLPSWVTATAAAEASALALRRDRPGMPGTGNDPLPPPARIHAAGLTAYEMRAPAAVVAELLFDSAVDGLPGVRARREVFYGASRRAFRFGALDSVISVHLAERSLLISIQPAQVVACRVVSARHHHHAIDHRTDEYGELAVDRPELPLRVEFEFAEGTVVTPWITG